MKILSLATALLLGATALTTAQVAHADGSWGNRDHRTSRGGVSAGAGYRGSDHGYRSGGSRDHRDGGYDDNGDYRGDDGGGYRGDDGGGYGGYRGDDGGGYRGDDDDQADRDRRDPDRDGDVDRDVDEGGAYPPAPVPPPQPTWIGLASGIAATGDRQFVHFSEADRLSTLRVDVASGAAFVQQIGVIYDRGRNQAIPVQRWMGGRDGGLVVSVDPSRRAVGVVVYTTRGGTAVYSVGGR